SVGSGTPVSGGNTTPCPLKTGRWSRNATTSGSSSTTWDGSLPATTAQNRQPSPGTTRLRSGDLVGGAAIEVPDCDVRRRRRDQCADAAGNEAQRADDDR